MIRPLALAGLCLALSSTALAQAPPVGGTTVVQRDAWAIERIAQVAESDRQIPRDLLHTMISQSLDTLRGAAPDGFYRWARYVREEAGRDSDRVALRPTGPESPDTVQSESELVYALRVEVPNRRMLVARNRRAYIDRIELDFRELGAFRRQETIQVGAWIEPGDGREFPLPEIARRATATVIGWGDPNERGSASVELTWLQPVLADDPASPYAGPVATLKQLRSAVDQRQREQIAQLAAQLARQLDTQPQAARQTDLVRPEASRLPINRDELLYELRTIDELMRTRGVSSRGTAEERLTDLIRRVEQLPIR